jgi:hypothetical protein
MFLLDSLMISGISWALRTVVSAAEAEMNDDSALREALLESEMRREMGEISDDEFAEIEADLLARIRAIKQRRDGGSGPLAFGGAQPMETSPDSKFQIEAEISGDFYGAPETPHTDVVTVTPDGVEAVVVSPVIDRSTGPAATAAARPARAVRRTAAAAAAGARATSRPTGPTRARRSRRSKNPKKQ